MSSSRRPAEPARTPCPGRDPGHTFGHTSFFLPNIGVLITGDTVVTAHPTFNGVGPRLLPADFSHEHHSAINALKTIRELDAEMFVPGHGPVWYGPISDAVDQALDQATHNGACR